VTKTDARPLNKRDFETLADFRYQIRKFVRFSEQLALRHGLKPQQYLLLLQIRGYPGRDWATVGELAERLQAHHHGVVALISRCETLGLVQRRRSAEDRRQIEVRVLEKGDKLLNKLARLHRAELVSLQGRFVVPTLRNFQQR
jgi:DNA-binding MarR family transcriptional regulator